MTDPGLQPQRVALAWVRTALLLGTNALLMLRGALEANAHLLLAPGAALGCTAIWLAFVARSRETMFVDGGVAAPRKTQIASVAFATAGTACVALLMLLV